VQSRTLLVVGLILVGASLVGPGVQASMFGSGGWWDGHPFAADHMNGHPFAADHMIWSWNTADSAGRLEGAREVTVIATEFAFDPAQVTVDVGEPVNITLVNDGAVPHDFVVAGLDVHVAAGPGETATVGIQVDKAGSFEILCSYPGHAGSGMTGVLTVRAAS